MNRLELVRYRVEIESADADPDGLTDVVVPVIDGSPLHERLGDRWPGLSFELLVRSPGQWAGSPVYTEHGRPVVLEGSCGIAGCCGVVARIDVGATTVVWSDIYGHGRPAVPQDLRFEFDRAEYEQALARIADLPPREWHVQADG